MNNAGATERFSIQRMVGNVQESGKLLDALIAIVVFGSIWGFLEATLGGFLHLAHFTHKGAVMGGIGMSIMAAFVAGGRHPSLLVGVGFVAALFKPLSALIYGQPIFAQFVINPAVAIILEALAFGLVVTLLLNLFQRDIFTRITAGIAAGYLSMVFYAIFATTFDRGYWPFLSFSEQVNEVVSDGTGIAIAGSVLLLVAYALASYLRPRLSEIREFRPGMYYGGAGATAVSCWGFASIAFAAGL